MSTHHKYSASGAEGWMTCSGKPTMEYGLPDENTVYGMEGSAAHFLGSECLIRDKDAVEFADRWIAVCSTKEGVGYECFAEDVKKHSEILLKFEVTEEMVEAVQMYIDHVRNIVKSESGMLFVERRVCFGAMTNIGDAYGTSDAIILSGDYSSLIVVDLKYGFLKVPAFRNKQMLLYAIGALDHISPIVALTDVYTFKMVIVQPRLKIIDSWETGLQEIVSFCEVVKTAHDKCLEAEQNLLNMPKEDWLEKYVHPSEKGCQWCKAKPFCTRLANSVVADTNALVGSHLDGDFTNLDFQETYAEAVKKLQVIPMEELGDAYSFVSRHKLYIEAIENAFHARMVNGEQDGRYKLVNGRKGNRKWCSDMVTDRKSELKHAMNTSGFKYEALFKTVPISPAEADRRFKKYPELLNRLSQFIEQDPPKPVVALMEDSRVALSDTLDFNDMSTNPNLLHDVEFSDSDF